MIFVSVGTTKFKFTRLFTAVDLALIKLRSREELIVQSGINDYIFKYKFLKVSKEIAFNEMILNIKKARVFITHGGPATIFQGLGYGKNLPCVVPRSGKLGEHVNEHQVLFIKRMEKDKNILVAFPSDDLIDKIDRWLRFPVRNSFRNYQFLPKRLCDYLDRITLGDK